MTSGLRPGHRDPAGWLLPACPPGTGQGTPGTPTHLSPVTSVCTEDGVKCAYAANGEQWTALLAPGAQGSCPHPRPVTLALCSQQLASAPMAGSSSIPGTKSTEQRMAWGAALWPAVGPTAPSRDWSTPAAPPRPPPRPSSPSRHPCRVRQTRGYRAGLLPYPRPESGRSRDPAEPVPLGRSPCSQKGPASSRPPGRTDAPAVLWGLRLPARGRRCKWRCPGQSPGRGPGEAQLEHPCPDLLPSGPSESSLFQGHLRALLELPQRVTSLWNSGLRFQGASFLTQAQHTS